MSNERVRKEKQDLEALCCLDYIFIVYYYITIGLWMCKHLRYSGLQVAVLKKMDDGYLAILPLREMQML